MSQLIFARIGITPRRNVTSVFLSLIPVVVYDYSYFCECTRYFKKVCIARRFFQPIIGLTSNAL